MESKQPPESNETELIDVLAIVLPDRIGKGYDLDYGDITVTIDDIERKVTFRSKPTDAQSNETTLDDIKLRRQSLQKMLESFGVKLFVKGQQGDTGFVVANDALSLSFEIDDIIAVREQAAYERGQADKAPMGVSEWRTHGETHGYWSYFEARAVVAEAQWWSDRVGHLLAADDIKEPGGTQRQRNAITGRMDDRLKSYEEKTL